MMEKTVFTYKNDGKVVAEFDNESDQYKTLIGIAIKELENIIHLKGSIYESTLSPSNAENFKDDMKILMACDITIRSLKSLIGQVVE